MAVQCSQALAWTLLVGCLAVAQAIHDTGAIRSQAGDMQAGGMGAGSGNDVCSGDDPESCSPPINENAPGGNEGVCRSFALPGGACGSDGVCCSDGECCSGEGQCVETPERCGPMCQVAYSAIDSPCYIDPLALCDRGMQYKPRAPCGPPPNNMCCGNALSCAKNYICIVKPGPGNCLPDYGAPCPPPPNDGVLCRGLAQPGGNCGPSNRMCCPDKHCCSKGGICVPSKIPNCDFCYPDQSGKDSLCWLPPTAVEDGLTGDGSECGQDTGFCQASTEPNDLPSAS